MESWRGVVEVALEWPFPVIAAVVVLLLSMGVGRWHMRWRRGAWIVALLLLGLSLFVGLGRQEWRDVLFNGQLL